MVRGSMRRGASLAILLVAVIAPGAAAQHAGVGSESVRIDDVKPLPVVARSAVSWCGTGQPTALDRQPNLDLSSTRQVHVSYAIPSDSPDQFASFAPRMATDVEAIDTWWRGQDPTRTVRFDLFAFPGCTTTFGKLDIGFVRLPRPASSISAMQAPTGFCPTSVSSARSRRTRASSTTTGRSCSSRRSAARPSPRRMGRRPADSRASPSSGRSRCVAGISARARSTPRSRSHELIHGLGAVPIRGSERVPVPQRRPRLRQHR